MTLDDLAAIEKGASDAPWHSFGNTLYLRKVSPENPGTQNMDFFWMPGNSETARFIAAMRNHARALIEVARAAKVFCYKSHPYTGDCMRDHYGHDHICTCGWEALTSALSRLEGVGK